MKEHTLIARYFTPLAPHKAAGGLLHDAAQLAVPPGHELVLTKDAISEGIHFIGDEPPARIAQKLLRTNLSDLAATGAAPLGYLLALMLPPAYGEAWIEAFTEGLRQDQQHYGLSLLGGDTTRTNGSLCLSLTALGLVKTGSKLNRAGARPGDGVYVSGTLGDGALGLRLLKENLDASADARAFLLQRYQLPEPRLALGQALHGIASACMDISDGLAQDMGQLCKASDVGAIVHARHLPVSPAARTLAPLPGFRETILTGGDDYELLFTVPPDRIAVLESAAKQSGTALTRIGEIAGGAEVIILDEAGAPVALPRLGFDHFA